MSLTIGTEYNVYTSKEAAAANADARAYGCVYDYEDDYAKEMAARKQKNVDAGLKGIETAKQYGYNDTFDLTMETGADGKPTGTVIIKLKEDVTFGEVGHKLGIPDGKLYEYNKETLDKYGTNEIGDTGIETHDTVDAPKGLRLIIPGGYLNPHKPIGEQLKDLWGAIKSNLNL